MRPVTQARAASEAARGIVEGRFLDGRRALFPDVAAAWDEQVKSTEVIADTAVRLAELDGVPPAASPDAKALARRTTELVADLVEPAKATALETLGEGRRALDIAAAWVRSKVNATAEFLPEVPAP